MELWVPFAKRYRTLQPTKGFRPDLYPRGLIVHYTAGRDNPTATLDYSIAMGYSFMVIDKSGQLWQAAPIDQWGSHAGQSYHPEFGSQVSKSTVGVEILCAGALTIKQDGLYTCFGDKVLEQDARYVETEANRWHGYYEKYTQAQEETLANLCWWLKGNSPLFEFDLVLGHDEVCVPKGRKVDPGGSLSKTMPAFREYLKQSYTEVKVCAVN